MDRLRPRGDLTRTIQEQIKRHITERHLLPGDLLPPEGQLAADMGVSRGSVREAVKALETLGILEVRHGAGIIVREFNFDSVLDLLTYGLVFEQTRIDEILQIRKCLETAVIDLVVKRITEAQIQGIETLLARWEDQVAAGQPTSEMDRAFHRMLYEPVANRSLISLLDVFWLVFHAVPVRSITTDMRPSTTVQDHRDILAAVRRRDPVAARARILDHFRYVEQRIAEAAQRSEQGRITETAAVAV